ncbi:MAG: PAS domain-containing sensor histidine kinase [Planctomycetota bacterium]
MTVSILLGADMLGLVPNRRAMAVDARKTICESLAVQFSVAVATDQFGSIERSMRAVVGRNDELISLRMKTVDGNVLAEAGDHGGWEAVFGEQSSTDQVIVPIFRKGERWGSVEVHFDAISGRGPLGFPWGGIIELCLFSLVVGFGLFFFFIRKTLRHLDPSAVIPGRVQSTLDVLAEGVVLLDKDERIVMANSAFSKIANEAQEELVGRRASELDCIGPEYGVDRVEDLPWRRVLEEGQSEKGLLIPLQGAAGDQRHFSVNGAPILDPNGAVRGAMATFDDVTEIEKKNDELEHLVSLLKSARDEVTTKNKELQATNSLIEAKVTERTAELRASMEAAKAADQAKSAFLANISHELRTPMHAILSFSEFGIHKIDQVKREKLLRYFEHVQTSGQSLLSLLNNLLDLSKVQANKMEFRLERVAIGGLIEHVVEEFGTLAESRGVVLKYTEPSFEAEADLDKDRIIQVIRNLVSNAIKFTQVGGTIELGMRNGELLSPDGETTPSMEVWVADEGVGIPEDQLEAIFDPFTQSSRTDSGSGGTGLGLAICDEIVSAHGGWIRALNRPEGGAIVEFAVPCHPVIVIV